MASRASGPPEGPALSSPVGRLKRVGAHMEELLARLEIRTVQDLLFHLPVRYQDRTRVTPIGALQAGDEAVIEGEVLLTEVRYGRRRMLLSRLGDGTGAITLRFFHFSARQQEGLARGTRLRCYGEVRGGPGKLEMAHPEYAHADVAAGRAAEPGLTPIYPVTAGLRQSSLRGLVAQALACADAADGEDDPLRELLPAEVIARHGLGPLRAALEYLHRPPPGPISRRSSTARTRCASGSPSRSCSRISSVCARCAPACSITGRPRSPARARCARASSRTCPSRRRRRSGA